MNNFSKYSHMRDKPRVTCPHPHLKCCLRCGSCACVFTTDDEENDEDERVVIDTFNSNSNPNFLPTLKMLANKYDATTSSITTTHLYGSRLHPRYTSRNPSTDCVNSKRNDKNHVFVSVKHKKAQDKIKNEFLLFFKRLLQHIAIKVVQLGTV